MGQSSTSLIKKKSSRGDRWSVAAGSGEPGPGNDVKMSFLSVKGLVFIKRERRRWFTKTGIDEVFAGNDWRNIYLKVP